MHDADGKISAIDVTYDIRMAAEHLSYWGPAWVRPDVEWQDASIHGSWQDLARKGA